MNRVIKNRFIRAVILGLLALAVSSCLVVVSGPSHLNIANNSGYTLIRVYISVHSSTVWGDDQLSPDVLTPGSVISYRVDPGYYDVMVIDSTLHENYAYDVRVTAGNTTTLYYTNTSLGL